MRYIILVFGIFTLSACSTVPINTKQVQLLKSDSTLVNGCEKLGPIQTDTRGNPFNYDSVAENEFKRIASEKYNADSAVITSRDALPFGQIRLEGTALKCYKQKD